MKAESEKTVKIEDAVNSLPKNDHSHFHDDNKVWADNVTRFLAKQFGEDKVEYLGAASENDEAGVEVGDLHWKVLFDEHIAEVYCGKDGKGMRIISESQETHKRVTVILNRVFKTLRPLEDTWTLVRV